MQEVANVIDCLHSKKPKEIENGNKFLLQLFNISEGGKLALSKSIIFQMKTMNFGHAELKLPKETV